MIARKLKYKIVNLAVIAVFISVVAVTGCQNTQKGNEQENGKVKETEQRDQKITDVTTLTQLTNKEGDEEVTSLGSNRYEWENHGEDIHYEGTADPGTLLPVSVKLTHYLTDRRSRQISSPVQPAGSGSGWSMKTIPAKGKISLPLWW